MVWYASVIVVQEVKTEEATVTVAVSRTVAVATGVLGAFGAIGTHIERIKEEFGL